MLQRMGATASALPRPCLAPAACGETGHASACGPPPPPGGPCIALQGMRHTLVRVGCLHMDSRECLWPGGTENEAGSQPQDARSKHSLASRPQGWYKHVALLRKAPTPSSAAWTPACFTGTRPSCYDIVSRSSRAYLWRLRGAQGLAFAACCPTCSRPGAGQRAVPLWCTASARLRSRPPPQPFITQRPERSPPRHPQM